MFARLYDRVMSWASHPHATWYLGGLSFAESSFFPIPPDVLLAPMALGRPHLALYFASITTIASVLGGVLGYAIGYFALEAVSPWLHQLGYWDRYTTVQAWFVEWGFWAVFAAGFSPVPYKLFTIAAGTMSMSLPAFVLASLISRGLRFFLVAFLMMWGGPAMEKNLRKHIDTIGWGLVAIIIAIYLYVKGTSG